MRRTAAAAMLTVITFAGCGTSTPAASSADDTTTAPSSSTSSTSSTTTTDETTTTTTEATAPSDYTFNCYDADMNEVPATSMADVHAQHLSICDVTVADTHKLSPLEARAVKEYKLFNSDETAQGALETMLGICVETAADDGPTWDAHVLRGTLMLCPRAPLAAQMRSQASGRTFDDGDYAVGVDVKPGTYRTEKDMHNCYWERTTKGGGTIANDFVTYAASGVTVTIRSSDGGFSSEGCGTWTRVR